MAPAIAVSSNAEVPVSNTSATGRTAKGIVVGAVLLAGVFLVLRFAGHSPNRAAREINADTAIRVTYKVSGSAKRVSLAYANASGGREQTTDSLPWTLDFKSQPGSLLQLFAQKVGDSDDSDDFVEVRIFVDTNLLQQAKSDSPHGIASVSGVVRVGAVATTPAEQLNKANLAMKPGLWPVCSDSAESIPRSAPEADHTKMLDEKCLLGLQEEVNEKVRNYGAYVTETNIRRTGDTFASVLAVGEQLRMAAVSLKSVSSQKSFLHAYGNTFCEVFREVRFEPGQTYSCKNGTLDKSAKR